MMPMHDPMVYIVDDDPDMRDSLRWLMKNVGLRVATFSSAVDFLRDFNPCGPGCLVFDVRMPGTSGLDLFEELVARGQSMPAIFITAIADVPMAIRAMKSGAVEFVEKPFNRQTLLEKVQRAIRDDVARHRQLAESATIEARFRRLTDKERVDRARSRFGEPPERTLRVRGGPRGGSGPFRSCFPQNQALMSDQRTARTRASTGSSFGFAKVGDEDPNRAFVVP
jgi:FixJ family two-component response regulator